MDANGINQNRRRSRQFRAVYADLQPSPMRNPAATAAVALESGATSSPSVPVPSRFTTAVAPTFSPQQQPPPHFVERSSNSSSMTRPSGILPETTSAFREVDGHRRNADEDNESDDDEVAFERHNQPAESVEMQEVQPALEAQRARRAPGVNEAQDAAEYSSSNAGSSARGEDDEEEADGDEATTSDGTSTDNEAAPPPAEQRHHHHHHHDQERRDTATVTIVTQHQQQQQQQGGVFGLGCADVETRYYGETELYSEYNHVLFKGRVVLGPQVHQLVASICLLTIPVVLTSAFYGSFLQAGLHVVMWIFYAVTVVALVRCATTDPGIVAKRMRPVEGPPRQVVTLPTGVDVNLRMCPTCYVYRGPRTHHCGICDNCVDYFDHHCPWSSTCIGAHNYRPFFLFLHAMNLTALFLVINATVVVTNISSGLTTTNGGGEEVSVWSAIGTVDYIPIAIYAYVFLCGNSVTGLLFIHWYLVVHNLTTAEHLKATYDGDVNPWDKGVLRNFLDRCVLQRVDKWIYSYNYRYKVVELVKAKMRQAQQSVDELDPRRSSRTKKRKTAAATTTTSIENGTQQQQRKTHSDTAERSRIEGVRAAASATAAAQQSSTLSLPKHTKSCDQTP